MQLTAGTGRGGRLDGFVGPRRSWCRGDAQGRGTCLDDAHAVAGASVTRTPWQVLRWGHGPW